MVRKGFQNALCREAIPDIGGYGYRGARSPYQMRCRRRRNHSGKHRVRFSDGSREWADGDSDSTVSHD